MSFVRSLAAETGAEERRTPERIARTLAIAAVALVAVVAIARLVLWTGNQQVAFDGAMNLEAARSMVEGQGYRRMYGDRDAFPHEIQTRAPYILPAAAVFGAFGVGLWQAQLTNLLYLFAFAAAAFVLVARATSWRWGLLAAATCLATPGIEDWGMNGYGEVPALTWWLLSLLVLYPRDGSAPIGAGRCFAAGLLAGLAVVTKTVLAIGLVALLPVLVAEIWRRQRRLGPVPALLAAFAAGALAPLLLHEVWRGFAIGDWALWKAWLEDEWQSVQQQAGVRTGFDDTGAFAGKIAAHFQVLAAGVGLAPWLLAAWLVLPALLLAGLRRRLASCGARPLVLTLAVFALIYFCWWLGVTPTQKAWYRRVFNGVLVLQMLATFTVALLWRERTRARYRAPLVAATATAIALQAGLAWSSLGDSGNWASSASRELLDRDLAAIGSLPAEAALYGAGWYSLPAVALYSGRHIDDLNAKLPADLAAQSRVYLLADPPMWTSGAERYWLRRFPWKLVAESLDLRVFELTTDRVRDPFDLTPVDPATVRGYFDVQSEGYAYAFGFHGREGDGWTWARPDTEVLLRYAGEAEFKLDVFLPQASSYQLGTPPGIRVLVGDCELGVLHPAAGERTQPTLPMSTCPQPERPFVHVRLVADNLLDSADDRPMSYVLRGVGFAGGAP
ncbi:hypothetical protein [Dokdonella ginsengisoli]|uniref:Glycosyltransferase RgtA/B/C/D-like domain-containing protein n=1 Tax=Dokdonella ginsengisoli TaxID=363846 RepID=A0ABV9QUW1_9GAMM